MKHFVQEVARKSGLRHWEMPVSGPPCISEQAVRHVGPFSVEKLRKWKIFAIERPPGCGSFDSRAVSRPKCLSFYG